jgi:hypothetical protein
MPIVVLLFAQANKFSAKAKIHSCLKTWKPTHSGDPLGLVWKLRLWFVSLTGTANSTGK